MNRREAAQHKLHFLALLAEKVRAELSPDMAEYQKMEFADLPPDDALRQGQRVCQSCGAAWLPTSNFCPNCGAKSKRLQASQEPAPSPPTLVGRLNIAGVTAEVYEGGEVVILTPCPVSMTVVRLGTANLGVYEARLRPLNQAVAPTSIVNSQPPFVEKTTR
jgi:hypothetical protein